MVVQARQIRDLKEGLLKYYKYGGGFKKGGIVLKVKRIISLLLVFALAVPLNTFAAADTDGNTLELTGGLMSLEELKAAGRTALEKPARQLPEIGRRLGENITNPDLYFKPDDRVRVIVEVSGKPVHSLKSTSAIKKLEQTQKSVMSSMKSRGIDAEIRHRFVRSINGFSAVVNYSDIAELKKITGVEKVHIAKKYRKDMNTSRGMVNADIVNKAIGSGGMNLKGEGMLVAIVDTGIDYEHQDLSNITNTTLAKYKDEAAVQARLNATPVEDDVWYNEKVVSGYDWADMDNDVIPDLSHPLASPHGVHVAGIVAANAGDLELDENSGRINGIAPEAQLLAEKVFSDDDEYAYDDDIIAGINHAIDLDADVINMSLGDVAGFVGADADPIQAAIDEAVKSGIIVCVSAGNAGHNTKGVYSTWPYPMAKDPDIGLVGSPGVGENTLQVASYENDVLHALQMTYYYDGVKKGDALYQAAGNVSPTDMNGIELVYCGLGGPEDFTPEVTAAVAGKVALIERGTYNFSEKQINAQNAGAVGVVVFNHSTGGEGLISMATHPDLVIPAVFVGRSVGLALYEGIGENKEVTLEFALEEKPYENPSKGRMMDGSSWGVTPNLDFKPEITAPGGNIFSTVNNNDYESMSGTSMSSPCVAGAAALMAQHLHSKGIAKDAAFVKLVKAMLINTAETIMNPDSSENAPYSPRLQGSGLMKIDKAVSTPVVVTEAASGKAAVSLYEVDADTGMENFTLRMSAFSDFTVPNAVYNTVYYNVYANAFTDLVFEDMGLSWNGLESVPVKNAKIIVNSQPVSDTVYEEVYVERNGTSDICITLDLTTAGLPEESFIEGFISFVPTASNPDLPRLTVPYTGFYGNWDEPRNIDPGIWEPDSYGGYTGLYEAVPEYNENNKLEGYALYQLGKDLDGNVNPYNVAISPNGDDIQEAASLVFTLLRNAKRFKLYIKDSEGNTVREIFDNKTWVNEGNQKEYEAGIKKNYTYNSDWYTLRPGVFDWNGTLNDGSQAPDGNYTMAIETTIDYPGAKPQTYELPVRVDTVAPVVDVLEITKEGSNYRVAWDIKDKDSGIYCAFIAIDGTIVDIVGSAGKNSIVTDKIPSIAEILVWDYAGNSADTKAYYNSIAPAAATFDKNPAYRADIAVAVRGSKLNGIKKGSTALVSGADYTVSGSTITIKKEYLNTLPLGNTILTFDFSEANDCDMSLNIINTTPTERDDSGRGGGSGGSGGGSTTPTSTPAQFQAPVPVLDSKGIARIALNTSMVNNALISAAVNKKGIKEVIIPFAGVKGAAAYTLALPSGALANSRGGTPALFRMQTELGSITLPDNMLTPDMAAQGSTVGISFGLADKSGLSPELKALIGDKPVYDLNFEINGVRKDWNNPDAPVTVSLDYKPTAEELSNPDGIVIWYLDPVTNTPVAIPNCKYDPETGQVTFIITHMSRYAISYVKPVLEDIDGYAWAENQISAVIAKGIMRSLSGNKFSPGEEITRGDFVFGLVRTLGLSAGIDENFDDVKKSDYYYNELGVARKLGIVNGTGSKKFNPDTAITRQDMMTIVSRALEVSGKSKAEKPADLNKFADQSSIAAYARQSVAKVVAEGIIKGDGKNLNPLYNVTRAEAAVIMHRLSGK